LLLIFAESNKLVNNCQHEFVRGISSLLTYLTTLNSGHAHWMRDTELMGVIYLDYKKAFDTVPHKRLLLKLKNYGLPVKYVDWIANFLADRKIR